MRYREILCTISHMTKLIFISGSINSGKSTTSQKLAELLPNSALIHGDTVRHFVTWLPLQQALPITLQNIADIAKNFLEAGLNVIVDYPLEKKQFEALSGQLLDDATSVQAFVLSPRLEVAQSQRGERVLSAKEIERIAYHYQTNMHDPSFGICIDNSEITIEETAQMIYESIKNQNSIKIKTTPSQRREL